MKKEEVILSIILFCIAVLFFWFMFYFLPHAASASEIRSCHAQVLDCDGDYNNSGINDGECITPTLTIAPTIEPTPSAGPSGELTPTETLVPPFVSAGNPGDTNAPSGNPGVATGGPVCTVTIAPPVNLVMQRISPTSINLRWWKSTDDTELQDIEYGLTEDGLVYGAILNSQVSNYTITELPKNHLLWGKVCAFKNGCKSCTNIIDP